MRAVVVGNGPSAAGFVPPAGVTVIAVNGAIEWLSRADYFFTLDLSRCNVHRLLNQRAGVNYVYAFDRPCSELNGKATFYRRICGKPFSSPVVNSPQWWANRWGCKFGLSNQPGFINTGNSAWGALGLAYQLGAEKVLLVGVDANQQPRLTGGVPGELCHLPLLFESAIGQIDFVNSGHMKSALPHMPVNEGLDWLCR